MSALKTGRILVGLLAVAGIIGLSLGAVAETVSIKTNDGDVLQGALSGLAAMLRLEDPVPQVGPAAQFDIPLPSIQQIWVDFPRVVIETAEHVIIGPYSAFSGIAQMLRVERFGDVQQIPFAAIRQIAFGDTGFRELPREWLGQSWLNQRIRVIQKAVAGAAAAAAAIVPATTVLAAPTLVYESSGVSDIVWNGAAPAAPATTPATSSGELPWWVLLIGVAVLIAAFLFIPTGSSS